MSSESSLVTETFITTRNSSCGKVMFTQVSVCPWGGMCIPACNWAGGVCLGRSAWGLVLKILYVVIVITVSKS